MSSNAALPRTLPSHGRVLIVDDSRFVRASVSSRLIAAGYEVREAEDGHSALRILETEPGFDIVLTDLKMPSMDGFGLLDAVRTRGLDPDVIVLTGTHADDPQAAVRAFRLGATDFLAKSAPQEALVAVDQAIERRRHRAELRNAEERYLAERRKAEDALLKSERQLSEAQHLAHVGSWEVDLITGEVSWSDELYRMHGLPVPPKGGEISTAEMFWRQIHPDDRERVREVGESAVRDGAPFAYDFRIVRPDGEVRTLYCRGNVLNGAHQRATRLVGADQDVTELRDARRRLEVKTIQLEAVADAMMTFLSGGDLAHAARQLLSAAQGLTGGRSGFIGVVVDGPALQLLTGDGRGGDEPQGAHSLDNTFGRSLLSGHTMIANDPHHDARCDAALGVRADLRSLLALPVLTGREVVGVIAVENKDGGFSAIEEAQLQVLARACGVLFDSCRRARRELLLEDQLRQSQKLEAVGRLAGGIAHDFNNVLGVISGLAEILERGLSPDDARRTRVDGILKATVRAAALTRQLLAFSRSQVVEPKTVDLNAFVTDMHDMLGRLVGEDVEVALALSPTPWPVKIDQSQLEQIVMNLAVNARDAMPNGGRLLLRTANVELDDVYCRAHHGARPGPHVLLSVSDTGEGMDPETRAHIFEPFYTTKPQGKGTGLGLATVYGIVKQGGGYIDVASRAGEGTTFEIFLPRCQGRAATVTEGAPPVAAGPAGQEKVLVVEDDDTLRDVVCEILTSYGYVVRHARSGEEGLRVSEAEADINLVLTDVVMPGMNGRDMARALRTRRPDLKVLYMSGYSEGAVIQEIVGNGSAILPKPFSADALAAAVRGVLDGAPAASAR